MALVSSMEKAPPIQLLAPVLKGIYCATVASGACLGGKPRWIEAKRIGPQTPVPVNDIDGDDDGGAGGKLDLSQFDRPSRYPHQARSRWIESHRFHKHRFQQAKLLELVRAQRSGAYDATHLIANLVLPLRKQREHVEGPGQGLGRRFLADHQEGDDIVDDQAVGHLGAGSLIPRRNQSRQQVGAIPPSLAAIGEHAPGHLRRLSPARRMVLLPGCGVHDGNFSEA